MAQAAVSDGAAEIVRLLRLSGFLGDPPKMAADASGAGDVMDHDEALSSEAPGHAPIGIWEGRVENGKTVFVRRTEARHEWAFWTDVNRIEAKSEKTRVLLIGESVARGYLYDPIFNPAMALQMILESQLGKNKVEVIDLARMNLGFRIREVGINALQMEPDIAVIFAGNNWYISPRTSEIAEIDEAIGKQGIPGAKQAVEAQIARTARGVVRDLAAAYESKDIPLVWLIPEFNLRDWHDPITNAPYLTNELNKEWLELLQEAKSALRDQDVQRARKLAERMVEIDQGVCVAGFYILAECSRRSNDLESERKYLTLARDATSWDLPKPAIPRAYSVMQEAVRDETSKHNDIQVVELPALFKEYLHGELPDRRLFLDYCHLTTLGIQISMGAAASCVLRALKGIDAPWHTLGERVAPSPETEAETSLLTAIISSYCSQPYDVVHHFCTRALNHSRHVAQLMLNYMDLQIRISVPMQMSEAEEQIRKAGSPLIRGLLGWNKKRLDRVLLNAMCDALEEFGINGRERIERLCLEEHSLTGAETNLLDSYYCSAADQSQQLVWLNRGMDKTYRPDAEYYRAYWPESTFIFAGAAGCGAHLSLTCRLPKPALREKSIDMMLNGKREAQIIIGPEWSTWDIDFPPEVVREGLNEIVVRWPMPEFESGKALEKARLSLCERKFPDFYPIFGEIHSFTASSAQKAPAGSPVIHEAVVEVEV